MAIMLSGFAFVMCNVVTVMGESSHSCTIDLNLVID